MKKIAAGLFLLSLISCSKPGNVPDFSETALIYSSGSAPKTGDYKNAASASARKGAVKTALEIFSGPENQAAQASADNLVENYALFIKKDKIQDAKESAGSYEARFKITFLVSNFIARIGRDGLLGNTAPKTAVFPVFYSSYPPAQKAFSSAFLSGAGGSGNFEFYQEPFKDSSSYKAGTAYFVLGEIFSYSPAAASDLPVNMIPSVSSGSFKIYSRDMRLIDSFSIQKTAVGETLDKSFEKSSLALSSAFGEKTAAVLKADQKKTIKRTVIFSNVNDLNRLLELKKIIYSLPVPYKSLNGYYDNEAVFSVDGGTISSEELSSFILRAAPESLQIEYADKNEIKFDSL